MHMKHYTELLVWKNGLDIVREIYAITKLLPKEELFGITAQLRRCSTSILANIAEGCDRFTYADKAARFIISRGECFETEAFLLIIAALGFVPSTSTQKALALIQQERCLLSGLITSCRQQASH